MIPNHIKFNFRNFWRNLWQAGNLTGKHQCQSLFFNKVSGLFLIKLQALACIIIKKGLWHRCFPVSFCKVLWTTFLIKHFRWLLLKLLLAYSFSCNLTPEISRVLTDQHWILCSPTSPTCCNSPQKCKTVKYQARQKAGFPTVTFDTNE